MLVIVQPLSAGVALARQAVLAGHPCLIPTEFPELLPPEVHAGAEVVDWRPGAGVPALLELVERAGAAPAGVIAGFEYVVPEAAELARALGLPGLSRASAEAVRQKDLMRARCTERGIAVPGSVAVPPGPVGAAPFRYPVVVKPVDCGGSLMVRLARGDAEYAAACAEIHGAGADQVKFHPNPRRVALVEEYVEGPEFSVEGWVDGGGTHVASVTTKYVSAPPWFFETGHIATPPGQSPYGELLTGFTERVVAAFELTAGPFHLEARVDASGRPVLIEIGARLAGDSIPELVLAGPGVDLGLAAVDAACGRRHPEPGPDGRSAGLAFVTTDRPGVFAGTVSGLEPYVGAPEFERLVWEAEASEVLDPDDIFHNRVAQVHFRGDLAQVQRLVSGVLRDARVDITDKEGIHA
ncbi:acetyl-CoA carboxylase biotin carboxylase subunit family protein [Kitasatospora sp. NPDC101183]|uniref:ATP-grasp domain-containing protein n=1 Tax=Kitasatospora sp. NPDC101183 TaxID=3364100 RepID=UPI003813D9F0